MAQSPHFSGRRRRQSLAFLPLPAITEGTFKIPQGTSNDNANSNHLLTGSWPGWWMVGWDNVNQIATWGPEIDTFEFFGTTDKGPTDPQFRLHDNGTNPTLCFESGGTQQGQFVLHVIDTTNVTFLQEALGGFSYSPGTDYSAGYHRFGTKIDPNYNVELSIDDVKVRRCRPTSTRKRTARRCSRNSRSVLRPAPQAATLILRPSEA